MTALTLHASDTSSLLHAEQTGIRNTLRVLATLTDETGTVLADETGAVLTGYGVTPAIVLHAADTNTLLHAEDV